MQENKNQDILSLYSNLIADWLDLKNELYETVKDTREAMIIYTLLKQWRCELVFG